jgi:hypothetical protein
MATQQHTAAGVGDRPRRSEVPRPLRPHPLISVVNRLVLAQAGACAAIGIAFSRRNMPWLVLMILIAIALLGLSAIVRSGSHTTWLAAICVESALTAVGLFRFGYISYMGGTLLAIVTLGTLLHPAVARAFASAPGWQVAPGDHPAFADASGDAR